MLATHLQLVQLLWSQLCWLHGLPCMCPARLLLGQRAMNLAAVLHQIHWLELCRMGHSH